MAGYRGENPPISVESTWRHNAVRNEQRVESRLPGFRSDHKIVYIAATCESFACFAFARIRSRFCCWVVRCQNSRWLREWRDRHLRPNRHEFFSSIRVFYIYFHLSLSPLARSFAAQTESHRKFTQSRDNVVFAKFGENDDTKRVCRSILALSIAHSTGSFEIETEQHDDFGADDKHICERARIHMGLAAGNDVIKCRTDEANIKCTTILLLMGLLFWVHASCLMPHATASSEIMQQIFNSHRAPCAVPIFTLSSRWNAAKIFSIFVSHLDEHTYRSRHCRLKICIINNLSANTDTPTRSRDILFSFDASNLLNCLSLFASR